MKSMKYQNSSSRSIDEIVQSVETVLAKATAFSDSLTKLKAERDAAEAAFVTTLSEDAGAALITLEDRVRDQEILVAAIEDNGGAQELRNRALNTPEVFGHFAAGFADRVVELEKLKAPALKRLGELRNALTIEGLPFSQIEVFPDVVDLKIHHDAIVSAIGSANADRIYSERHGKNYHPKTFKDLYNHLTAPLPEAPAI